MDKDYFINDDDGYNWVSLSKPLSNYTQEELAEHLISNKNTYGTTQKIRIDGKIGGTLTTDFCETPKDFLDKYQNILDRAGFKKGNNMERVEEKNNKTKASKKAEIRIIEIPFGMIDYTQEDLAHLVMDGKNDTEVVGVRVKNGVVFDSRDCNTVEDFIAKNEKVANSLGIKHNIAEQIEKVGSIADVKYNNKIDPVIPKVSVSEPINKVEENIETTEVSEPIAEVKEETKIDYQENLNKLLKTREIRKAICLFNIPRGNYYNGTDKSEESKLSVISQKNNEYVKIFNEKENIDFNNVNEVLTWLNKLVPYINTHALNLNLGINVTTESADKYLLKIMEEKGYTTDISSANTQTQREIAEKLNELKEYHFFVSDFNNLSEEDKNLNSDKTNAMAEISYLETLIDDATRGLNLIGLDLATINNKSRVEKELLETQVNLIDQVLVEKGDDQFSTEITTSEERQANDAYKLASITYGVSEIEKAISYINLLPEDSKVKEKLSNAAYGLFNKQDAIDYTKYPELNNRDKYLEKLDKLDEEKEIVEERLKSKEKVLFDSMAAINVKLADLHSKYQIEEKKKEEIEEVATNEVVEENSVTANVDNYSNEEENNNDDYLAKLQSIGNIFTDEERIDPNHNYLTADNAKNTHLIDVVTEGPKEEVVSKIEMTPEDETINEIGVKLEEKADEFANNLEVENNEVEMDTYEVTPTVEVNQEEQTENVNDNIVEFETNDADQEDDYYDLSLDDDYYDLSLPDEKNSIVDFVTIKSFKQITKDLYDKINHEKVKNVVRKAIDKLRDTKKAACVYLGFAAVLVGTIAAGHSNSLSTASTSEANAAITNEIDNSGDTDNIVVDNTVVETTTSNTNETTNEEISTNEVVEENVTTEENVTQMPEEEEITVSLDEASNEAIANVLEGKNDVYRSFADASSETNAVDTNKLYTPSWENAQVGEYFVQENGVMNRLSKEQAEDYYKNGQEIVQSVENQGTVIGYVNVENTSSEKTK